MWMELEDIILKERSRSQEEYWIILPMRYLDWSDSQGEKVEWWVLGLGGGCDSGSGCLMDAVSVLHDENSGGGCWRWLYNNVNVLNTTDVYTYNG